VQTVILHGNCQMHDVAHHLRPLMAGTGYEIVFISSFQNWIFKTQPEPDDVARCAVFIEQMSPIYPGKWLPPTFKADLPKDCRYLRVPVLWMKSLWPFHHLDPRNEAIKTKESPSGRYPFGDSLVTRLLQESTDPDVVFQRYMDTDIRQLIDLDRYHEMIMADAHATDRESDLAYAPLLEREFRVTRLFDAVNHPACALIMRLRDDLAQFILNGTAVLTDVPAWIPLVQVPLHPQIVEYFKLEWIRPDDTHLYFQQPLTFTEYLRKLIAFE